MLSKILNGPFSPSEAREWVLNQKRDAGRLAKSEDRAKVVHQKIRRFHLVTVLPNQLEQSSWPPRRSQSWTPRHRIGGTGWR